MGILKYRKLWWLKIVIALATFFLDYGSKEWARANLSAYGSSSFIPSLLKFTLVHNTGAAFNLGEGHEPLMAFIATAVTLWLIVWVLQEERGLKQPSLLMGLGAGFLIGGALGNLVDRFVRGRVTDFLEFTFVSFPVFNLADVCIDVGIGLIIIFALKNRRQTESLPQLQAEKPAEEKQETI